MRTLRRVVRNALDFLVPDRRGCMAKPRNIQRPAVFRESISDPQWPARARLAAIVFHRPLAVAEALLALGELFKTTDMDRQRQLLANCEGCGFVKWDVATEQWVRCVAPKVQSQLCGADAWDSYVSPSCGLILSRGTFMLPPEQILLPQLRAATRPTPCRTYRKRRGAANLCHTELG